MTSKTGLFLVTVLCSCFACGTEAKEPGADENGSAAQTGKTMKKPARPSMKSEVAKPDKASVENAAALAAELDRYKTDLAQHISTANPKMIHADRPQALLRSVVVLRLQIDAHGRLIGSRIQRSNRDAKTEAAALASVRRAAPLPKPPPDYYVKAILSLLKPGCSITTGGFRSAASPNSK